MTTLTPNQTIEQLTKLIGEQWNRQYYQRRGPHDIHTPVWKAFCEGVIAAMQHLKGGK